MATAYEELKIGDVAQRAGVNIQTIRFYERKGLIKKPPRRESGYRVFGEEDVRVIRFIKRAQSLGFTLEEVSHFLDLRKDRLSCSKAQSLAEQKLDDIEQKLKDLRAMRKALKTLVASCEETGRSGDCPILESFEGDRK